MAELADALDLGSSGSNPVEVQILSPAPVNKDLLRKAERLELNMGEINDRERY